METNNKNYPLVSVAIITYNQEKFLREAIESVLEQTYSNIEIVVADDCSTDRTRHMLLNYENQYPGKFKLILGDKNLGITGNSNRAHFACTGKYIAWLGGDDLMMPDKISKQVDFMEADETCTICYHNMEVFNTEGRIFYFNDAHRPREGIFDVSIKYGVFNCGSSNMIRRNKTPSNGFFESIPVASDWLYWIQSLENGGCIRYIPEVLGRYRRHDNNVTSSSSAQGCQDVLFICSLMIVKYPHYAKFILKRYAFSLLSVRLKSDVNYISMLFAALRIHFSFKISLAIVSYFFSFGKLKL